MILLYDRLYNRLTLTYIGPLYDSITDVQKVYILNFLNYIQMILYDTNIIIFTI